MSMTSFVSGSILTMSEPEQAQIEVPSLPIPWHRAPIGHGGVDRGQELVARRVDPGDVAIVAFDPHGPEAHGQPVRVTRHVDRLDHPVG
jgi:hypothetical protein